MAVLKLSAPWETYYKELSALFAQDAEVNIIYDRENFVIDVYVDNQAKAEALTSVIIPIRYYGSQTLKINVVPSNNMNSRPSSGRTIFDDLFKGNPIVNQIVTLDVMSNPITYVIFKKVVVQYFNDNLGDAHGMCSTLYQDIAKRVLDVKDGVFFCTDIDSSYDWIGF